MNDPPDSKTRHGISKRRRKKYGEALALPNSGALVPAFKRRTTNLQRKLNSLLRKQPGSRNMEKDIARISSIIFGILEDIKSTKAVGIDLSDEIQQLNQAVISILKRNIDTFHEGLVPNNRLGETLLGCYLNCAITLTVFGEGLIFGERPTFLWYSETQQFLEVDIGFESFNLGFEFQGEHHFFDPKVQQKDAFKVRAAAAADTILIPISMAQLSGNDVLTTTANLLMDFVGVRNRLSEEALWSPTEIKYSLLPSYAKAIHRIYLASTLFEPALSWLDSQSQIYISDRRTTNPRSATEPAPVYRPTIGTPLSIAQIYKGLGYVQRLRR
jgi:hypothetical protein